MSRRKWSIRNYNAFLKKARTRGKVDYKHAQRIYREMKTMVADTKGVVQPLHAADIDEYFESFNAAIDRTAIGLGDEVIAQALDELHLREISGIIEPHYSEYEELFLLVIRGAGYERRISAHVVIRGSEIILSNWKTRTIKK